VSKKNEPSKTSVKAVQTELFTCWHDSGLQKGGGTSRGDQRMELFSRLEEQRTLSMSTMDSVSDPLHLLLVLKRVRENGASVGIDGVTANDYAQNLALRINSLQQRLDSGPLSPLLSNIVLDELDKELEARGLSFVRYADDCNILVSSERSAHRVYELMVSFIEGKLKLKVNLENSGVSRCDEVKFLGHTVMGNGKIRIADKSIERFKKKIREVTKRNRAIPLGRLISETNLIIQGWATYFRKFNTWLSGLKEMDGWIRNRIRCLLMSAMEWV